MNRIDNSPYRRSFGAEAARNTRGNLSFSIVVFFLVVLIIAGGLGFAFNVGMSAYYQAKLLHVADQAAHHAAARYCWYQNVGDMNGVQEETQVLANKLLADIGLPAGVVRLTQVKHLMMASVHVSGLVQPGKGNLPAFIDVKGIATADLNADQPPGLVYLTFQNDPQHKAVVLPSWGWYVGGVSDAGVFPTPLEDINSERGFNSLYYTVSFALQPPTVLKTGANTPKAPGIP